MSGGPADIPPRMARILYRLVVASFALATTALGLAGWCFVEHGGDVVAAAAAVSAVAGTTVRALLLWSPF